MAAVDGDGRRRQAREEVHRHLDDRGDAQHRGHDVQFREPPANPDPADQREPRERVAEPADPVERDVRLGAVRQQHGVARPQRGDRRRRHEGPVAAGREVPFLGREDDEHEHVRQEVQRPAVEEQRQQVHRVPAPQVEERGQLPHRVGGRERDPDELDREHGRRERDQRERGAGVCRPVLGEEPRDERVPVVGGLGNAVRLHGPDSGRAPLSTCSRRRPDVPAGRRRRRCRGRKYGRTAAASAVTCRGGCRSTRTGGSSRSPCRAGSGRGSRRRRS